MKQQAAQQTIYTDAHLIAQYRRHPPILTYRDKLYNSTILQAPAQSGNSGGFLSWLGGAVGWLGQNVVRPIVQNIIKPTLNFAYNIHTILWGGFNNLATYLQTHDPVKEFRGWLGGVFPPYGSFLSWREEQIDRMTLENMLRYGGSWEKAQQAAALEWNLSGIAPGDIVWRTAVQQAAFEAIESKLVGSGLGRLGRLLGGYSDDTLKVVI
ncbi:MAG: hypothetical protein QW761_01340, partial [Candidatus Aenigmatarchaeota archaeon]